MREILFRGKRVATATFVHGSHVLVADRSHSIVNDNGNFWVIPETVGQFTGLTDKNGKKIFEGDIILYKIPDGSYAHGIVKFRETNEVGFCVEWFNRHDTGWLRNDIGFLAKFREIEVIGNIHDNPELLDK